MRPLYLIDYSNWSYKFESTFRTKIIRNEVSYSTSVLTGFVRSLKSIPYKHVMICLDGTPTASSDIKGSYKGQRSKEPTELLKIPKRDIIHILACLGEFIDKDIRVVYSSHQEADQVIGSIAHIVAGTPTPLQIKMQNLGRRPLGCDPFLRFLEKPSEEREIDFSQFDTVIVGSTDSDMYQLIELGNVYIDTSTSGRSINFETTPKAVGFSKPGAVCAYKTLIGDVSDNVPGLHLMLRKEALFDLIQKHLDSSEKLRTFIRHTESDQPLQEPELESLRKEIIATGQTRNLSNNYRIVYLGYVSHPLSIHYHARIDRLIREYRIKV